MDARRLHSSNGPDTGPQMPGAGGVAGAGLVLYLDGNRFWIPRGDDGDFVIGRDEECDLVLAWPFVSRFHAHVTQKRQSYLLTDASSNGTYWRAEDGTVTYVHRKTVRLWGNGELSFGEPLSEQSSIPFQTLE